MPEDHTWIVPADLGGQRLDRIVAQLAGVSRALARRIVEEGNVLVEGERASPSLRVPSHRTITATVPDPDGPPAAADVPFTVLHEDPSVLVVDKPAGIVTHPGAGHRDDTLLNGLVSRYPELVELGEERRFGIVHRLDRGTSGLLVVARTAAAQQTLARALARREIERTYLAVVASVPTADSGTIDAPVGRDRRHPTRMALSRDGRPARTHYRVLAAWDAAALLEVRLETGRTHQIRVHCASIGAPVVGDDTYGTTGGAADPGRVWLHATRLSFAHPETGDRLEVTAPLPDDLTASLRGLGRPLRGALPG